MGVKKRTNNRIPLKKKTKYKNKSKNFIDEVCKCFPVFLNQKRCECYLVLKLGQCLLCSLFLVLVWCFRWLLWGWRLLPVGDFVVDFCFLSEGVEVVLLSFFCVRFINVVVFCYSKFVGCSVGFGVVWGLGFGLWG